jgi:hypothetical protein
MDLSAVDYESNIVSRRPHWKELSIAECRLGRFIEYGVLP